MEYFTVLWREWIFFKRRFLKITTAQMVTPILYILTFGIGIGNSLNVEGLPYLYYIIPGIVAMTTMRASYQAVAMRITVMRLHEKSFEGYLYSPTNLNKLVLGYMSAGALRGMFAAVLLIGISLSFGVPVNIGLMYMLVLLINSLLFAGLGYVAAVIINTHYDLNSFGNFIITPMSFLCGTFFSLKEMPQVLRYVVEIFPLTHTTRLLRSLNFDGEFEFVSLGVIVFYAVLFYVIGVVKSRRVE